MSFIDDMTNDLREILSGEFSEPATLQVGSVIIDITLIFDLATVEVDNEGSLIIGENPTAMVYIDDIDTAISETLTEASGATIVFRSITYKIKKINRDGTGFASIVFKK